jgi:hypothetical protein
MKGMGTPRNEQTMDDRYCAFNDKSIGSHETKALDL